MATSAELREAKANLQYCTNMLALRVRNRQVMQRMYAEGKISRPLLDAAQNDEMAAQRDLTDATKQFTDALYDRIESV